MGKLLAIIGGMILIILFWGALFGILTLEALTTIALDIKYFIKEKCNALLKTLKSLKTSNRP